MLNGKKVIRMIKNQHKYLYDFFKKKYGVEPAAHLGLFECACVASTYASNLDFAASAIILSPAGEAKTNIMRDVKELVGDKMIIRKGIMSEYWLIKHISQEELSGKTLAIDDLADSLKSMQQRRVAGLLSFLKNIIDKEAEILNVGSDIHYKLSDKVSIIINIPEQAIGGTITELISTTFYDRTLPFKFSTKWSEWEEIYLKKKLIKLAPQHLSLKPTNVKIPWRFEKQIVKFANELRSTKFASGLPRNINLIKAVLAGLVILDGRNEVTTNDIKIYEDLFKPYFRW